MGKERENPLEILSRGNELLRKELIKLDEMTYSVAVNTRDFSEQLKRIIEFWDQHSLMEDKILKVLRAEGYKSDIDNISFKRGGLEEIKKRLVEAHESGDEERIREVIRNELGWMVDLLRAHMLALENFVSDVAWSRIADDARRKIQLLQIIPSDKILEL